MQIEADVVGAKLRQQRAGEDGANPNVSAANATNVTSFANVTNTTNATDGAGPLGARPRDGDEPALPPPKATPEETHGLMLRLGAAFARADVAHGPGKIRAKTNANRAALRDALRNGDEGWRQWIDESYGEEVGGEVGIGKPGGGARRDEVGEVKEEAEGTAQQWKQRSTNGGSASSSSTTTTVNGSATRNATSSNSSASSSSIRSGGSSNSNSTNGTRSHGRRQAGVEDEEGSEGMEDEEGMEGLGEDDEVLRDSELDSYMHDSNGDGPETSSDGTCR